MTSSAHIVRVENLVKIIVYAKLDTPYLHAYLNY